MIQKIKNEKMYACVMLPYPSGSGLHVGHVYNYALMDSYCRWQTYKGYSVFQPFGYDSFGLPADLYAKKVGRDPKDVTYENIENFRRQMKDMNTNFEEKLITSDISYQKWSQFIFNVMRERGLAYKKDAENNWCNSCETVLANEQVINDRCERCKSTIEKRSMNQWYFKITDYIDRLEKNLDTIDYPESTKKQQKQWFKDMREQNIDWCISRQRKWGCPIPIEGETDTMDTFVDSSFYFIRYCDPDNTEELCSKEKFQQVDICVGGNEHACAHLIYARFVMMVLYDAGYVPVEEPFRKMIHQGMITKDGTKMSKSTGNTVDPDKYNANELRMYMMFIGPYTQGGDWSDDKIRGIRRFIGRWERWMNDAKFNGEVMDISEFEETIDKYMTSWKFNKVVSTFMEFYNKNKNKTISKDTQLELMKIYNCFIIK